MAFPPKIILLSALREKVMPAATKAPQNASDAKTKNDALLKSRNRQHKADIRDKSISSILDDLAEHQNINL